MRLWKEWSSVVHKSLKQNLTLREIPEGSRAKHTEAFVTSHASDYYENVQRRMLSMHMLSARPAVGSFLQLTRARLY